VSAYVFCASLPLFIESFSSSWLFFDLEVTNEYVVSAAAPTNINPEKSPNSALPIATEMF
jgi:hypothetical protein